MCLVILVCLLVFPLPQIALWSWVLAPEIPYEYRSSFHQATPFTLFGSNCPRFSSNSPMVARWPLWRLEFVTVWEAFFSLRVRSITSLPCMGHFLKSGQGQTHLSITWHYDVRWDLLVSWLVLTARPALPVCQYRLDSDCFFKLTFSLCRPANLSVKLAYNGEMLVCRGSFNPVCTCQWTSRGLLSALVSKPCLSRNCWAFKLLFALCCCVFTCPIPAIWWHRCGPGGYGWGKWPHKPN